MDNINGIEYFQLEETYCNHVVLLSDQFKAENIKNHGIKDIVYMHT